ncbi:MAG: hypothetical protein KDC92_06010 [Bacteroidetes bacterium]|nr:hypothetical protein [Bacteroidota bacterium]
MKNLKEEINSRMLTDKQKAMLEMSEMDIKTGRLISQEAVNTRNLNWLKALA